MVLLTLIVGSQAARKDLSLSESKVFIKDISAKKGGESLKAMKNIDVLQTVVGGIPRGGGGQDPIDTIFATIDVAGTALFAFSGALTAGRKGMVSKKLKFV
jgi:hypothetical protein